MKTKKIHNFTVIFEKEDDGGYHVFCPALRGCHTQGDTYDDALKNIRDAIALYIESLKAHKEQIPTEDVLIKPLSIAV
jgi:predicted RNase H-like HicB family nuclease